MYLFRHNLGRIWKSLSWCHDMETLNALLALCEGNPSVTDGFPSQRASNEEFDGLFMCYPAQVVEKNSRGGIDLGRHDARVTSL